MELRSKKKHPKLASVTSNFIDNGINIYLCINNTTIQIIDVSKVMESNDTGDANESKFENDLETVIGLNQETTIPPKLKKTNQVRQSKKKPYKKKAKAKRKKNKSHVKNYGTKEVMCDICGKSYSGPSYLKDHIQRHNETKDFKCDLCEKAFTVEKDLKNHVKTHLKERAFSCAICDKRFTRSSLLNYHMRIHTGERPYKCNICNMTFTRPFGLSQHKLRVHSSNKGKKLRCTKQGCDKMFVTCIERDMHFTIWHTRDMPFKCSTCKQTFSNRISLYQHNKAYHSTDKQYSCPCPGCDQEFNVIWSLQHHMKTCHKDFMYKCPHCPLEFKMKSKLNHHMKISNSHKTSKNN